LAGGGTVERTFAPCARFGGEGAADIAFAGRLQHGLNFNQLGLVILHVLDELADGVVGAVDLVVFGGEGLEEEGGERGGGDVLGGEPEAILRALRPLRLAASRKKWMPMDHSKSKKHLAAASDTLKKIRIVVFEHFTHQLVIVLVDELVTVCIRS